MNTITTENQFWRWVDKPGLDTAVVVVSPALAKRILDERNPKNRPLYMQADESYASDMKRGEWEITNQGIGFDLNGLLTDGQQRLNAIVLCGKPVSLLCVRGLNERAREKTDEGIVRGVGDKLHMFHGYAEGNKVAAIGKVLAFLCTGTFRKCSSAQVLGILREYQGEYDSVMRLAGKKKPFANAPAIGAFIFAAKCYPKEIADFERGYFGGANLDADGPILAARNFMSGSRVARTGPSRYDSIAAMLTALMHHVKGTKKLKRIYRSFEGRDFFSNRQQQTIDKIKDIFRY